MPTINCPEGEAGRCKLLQCGSQVIVPGLPPRTAICDFAVSLLMEQLKSVIPTPKSFRVNVIDEHSAAIYIDDNPTPRLTIKEGSIT